MSACDVPRTSVTVHESREQHVIVALIRRTNHTHATVRLLNFLHRNILFWGLAAQTLEILQRPGSYEKLEALSKRMVEGILAAAHDAGHEASGGYIRGMFGFYFNKGPVNNFTDAAKSDSGLCVCVLCMCVSSARECCRPQRTETILFCCSRLVWVVFGGFFVGEASLRWIKAGFATWCACIGKRGLLGICPCKELCNIRGRW